MNHELEIRNRKSKKTFSEHKTFNMGTLNVPMLATQATGYQIPHG
jgi:hypothetical protein